MIQCSSCSNFYRPPWSQKLQFERAPVQTADGGLWALAATSVRCVTCGALNDFHFPESPSGPRLTLYGDESYFWSSGKKGFYYVYAFVGAFDEALKKLTDRMHSCKLLIRPDQDPTSWNFHTSDLRNPHWLAKNNIPHPVTRIDEIMLSLAASLSEHSDSRIVSSSVYPCKHLQYLETNDRKDYVVRDHVITGSIVTLTDFLTQEGISPDFFLESVDNSASADFMDIYIERIGRGLFHSLSFLYCSRRKNVGLPTTVRKSEAVELEYADLVAFWTRRYFHCKRSNRSPEVPLEAFGSILWGAFTPRGYGTISSIGFPWEFFYPNLR